MNKLFLGLLAAMLVTCSSGHREPGYLYMQLESNPTTLDPALIVDVNGGAVAAKLFNGLVRLGHGLEIIPDIAGSWEVSRDGTRYTFRLRRGVRFSTGREVQAFDFKYSFERVLEPSTRSPNTWIFDKVLGAREFARGLVDKVSGFRVVDDATFEITLVEPFSPFLGLLTMPPAFVVPREEVLHSGVDFSSRPVGTGPYTLGKWRPNTSLRLEASPGYFEGPPKLKGIIYRIIPEELTTVAEFELGNLDVIGIPSSAFGRYIRSERWRPFIDSVVSTNTYYLGLNCAKPPFNDPEVRQAANHAIDRRKLLETLYEGRGVLAEGPVPGLLRSWEPPGAYEYDPERAASIIRRKGLDAVRVRFYVSADHQISVDIAEVIQSYLKAAGIEVEIVQLEWSAYKDAVNKGKAQMFWLSWWADYPDPENFLFPLFHSANHGPSGNRTRYSNPEVDRLITEGQAAFTPEIRDRAYSEAERIITREAPWVFFWHRTDYTIRQPWVERFSLYPVYTMDKGLEVSLRRPA